MNAHGPQHSPVTTDLPASPTPVEKSGVADSPNAALSETSERPAPAANMEKDAQATVAFVANQDTAEIKSSKSIEPVLFGRYQLQRMLGKGGMGEVYLAHDTLLQRTVALKLPRFADDSDVKRGRFLREARAAAVLSHPSICPVYDVGEMEGRPYLTMAYIEGKSLAEVVRDRGSLPPFDAARLVLKVALAMKHAHEHGILHRDLKPGNIQLNTTGEPVVMDFGLAFPLENATGERLTEHGLVVGTPAYMPPEQINAKTLGPATDVYSLGVVLYELLTGRVPFQGALGEVIAKVESTAPPRPRQFCPDLDPGLETICLKAMAKRPEDRYPDMASFAKTLEDYLQGRHVDETPDTTQEWRPPTRTNRQRMALASLGLAAVLGGAVATGTYFFYGVEPEDHTPEKPTQKAKPPLPPKILTQSDFDRLFVALNKPMLKIDMTVLPQEPAHIGRATLPQTLLKDHPGPLYFMIKGSGKGHVVDMSDQLGQGGQVTYFPQGDITVVGPYLLFLGNLGETSRIYVKTGQAYGILAPMNGGPGSLHVEFDGTHLLMPKINDPKIEKAKVTPTEEANLQDPRLTLKITWTYEKTAYVIYTRPDVKIVPGDHEKRKVEFPEVYTIIEADRNRQMNAKTIQEFQIKKAEEEEKKAGGK